MQNTFHLPSRTIHRGGWSCIQHQKTLNLSWLGGNRKVTISMKTTRFIYRIIVAIYTQFDHAEVNSVPPILVHHARNFPSQFSHYSSFIISLFFLRDFSIWFIFRWSKKYILKFVNITGSQKYVRISSSSHPTVIKWPLHKGYWKLKWSCDVQELNGKETDDVLKRLQTSSFISILIAFFGFFLISHEISCNFAIPLE